MSRSLAAICGLPAQFLAARRQVVAEYYNFVRLGREGYTRIAKSRADVGPGLQTSFGSWIASTLSTTGVAELQDAPGRCNQSERMVSMCGMVNRLRSNGWQVPAYPLPANRSDLVVKRMVASLA